MIIEAKNGYYVFFYACIPYLISIGGHSCYYVVNMPPLNYVLHIQFISSAYSVDACVLIDLGDAFSYWIS